MCIICMGSKVWHRWLSVNPNMKLRLSSLGFAREGTNPPPTPTPLGHQDGTLVQLSSHFHLKISGPDKSLITIILAHACQGMKHPKGGTCTQDYYYYHIYWCIESKTDESIFQHKISWHQKWHQIILYGLQQLSSNGRVVKTAEFPSTQGVRNRAATPSTVRLQCGCMQMG